MKHPLWKWFHSRRPGQGIIEYAGAMITAAVIVAMLATGIIQNNWMYNSYNAIFNAAGGMMIDQLGNL